MQEAEQRLMIIVPLSLGMIFVLLYIAFHNVLDAIMVFSNVLALSLGGLWALLLTGTNLNISAAVGFISIFGVAIMDGLLLISYFNQMRFQGLSLENSILQGAEKASAARDDDRLDRHFRSAAGRPLDQDWIANTKAFGDCRRGRDDFDFVSHPLFDARSLQLLRRSRAPPASAGHWGTKAVRSARRDRLTGFSARRAPLFVRGGRPHKIEALLRSIRDFVVGGTRNFCKTEEPPRFRIAKAGELPCDGAFGLSRSFWRA